MYTRNLLYFLLTVTTLFFAYSAHAGDFSMGSSDLYAQMDHGSNSLSSQLDMADEPIEIDSRSMRSSAREGMPSGANDFGSVNVDRDYDSSARVRQTNGEGSAPKRAATTDAAPAAKARPSSRWQSLVPGAIR